ncbi:Domain of unknown function DUF2435 [Phaffia rhodozyma]|uniref:RNA polymerase II assembly factor Rtp1 C-terminal domain-containing protein n=1 Tax=Phaffia rhodozyma TaxID=264483 RepID=A0A0F7SGJ9_PHARH|nr:Domain of unknown function DUF2435 [Phaffia rhodozyma]
MELPSLLPLLTGLKALYPVPNKKLARLPKITQSTLDSFYDSFPSAQHDAFQNYSFQQAFYPDLNSDQAHIRWQLGLLAVWAVELLDKIAREHLGNTVDLAKPPLLPVSTPAMVLTMLSHTMTQVLSPLFRTAYPHDTMPSVGSGTETLERSSKTSSSSNSPSLLSSSDLPSIRQQAGHQLTQLLIRLFYLALSKPPTDIGKLIRDGGIVRGILKMAVSLGWDHSHLIDSNELKGLVIKALDSYSPQMTLSLLSPLTSNSTETLPSLKHLRLTAGSLMTRSLLRPGGIEGLLQSLFGASSESSASETSNASAGSSEEGGDILTKKSESFARILTSVPAGQTSEAYFSKVIPRLMSLLISSNTPTTYLRPLSTTIIRLIPAQSSRIFPSLHAPLLQPSQNLFTQAPLQSVLSMIPLILLSPPSTSTQKSMLLRPIIGQVFGLYWHLLQNKTADVVLKEEVGAMLKSWAKVLSEADVGRGLEVVLRAGRGWEGQPGVLPGSETDEGEWFWEGGGEDLRVTWGVPQPILPPPSADPGSVSLESETLSLISPHPPPNLFTSFLKSLNRPAVAGNFFIHILDNIRSTHLSSTTSREDEDPKTLLLLSQMVVQMVEAMGEDLVKGEESRILSFISFVLENGVPTQHPPPPITARQKFGLGGLTLSDLKIVDDEILVPGARVDDDEDDDLDSDDEVDLPDLEDDPEAGVFGLSESKPVVESGEQAENEDGEVGQGKLGIVGTAIGLLVAVLQGNETLSFKSAPLLLIIKASLERHINSNLPAVRHLAKEALLIISVREATTSFRSSRSSSSSADSPEMEKALQTYRDALKLVSDPLVPVRAHGLIMLRQLVLPPSRQKKERPTHGTPNPEASLPPALIPGILDVFLQSIQDSDSYVYLNAVKGLAGLVDGWGKEVLGRMVGVYAKGVGNDGWEGTLDFGSKRRGVGSERNGHVEMERVELDLRLRVGEALCGVIERSDESLSIYSSVLVPRLLLVFRASDLPTALRSSSLAILSLVVKTSPLTAKPFLVDLVLACTDLLQIETVAMVRPLSASKSSSEAEVEENRGGEEDEEGSPDLIPEESIPDISPVLSNPKHPVLRRSALYFLSAAIRADINEDDQTVETNIWKSVARVVGYVRATDEDLTVRGLAGEVEVDLKRIALGRDYLP